MSRDWSKLDELILYVAQRCAGDSRFGKIKLNKILFYADFKAFLKTGKSITGENYFKQPFGPVPCHLEKRLKHLKGKDLEVVETEFFGRRQQRVVPKREARLDKFSGEEIAIVDDVIRQSANYTGSDISELSHRFSAWRVAEIGEEIPYEAALVQTGERTREKLQVAETLLKRARDARSK